jgi:hypothetical protein
MAIFVVCACKTLKKAARADESRNKLQHQQSRRQLVAQQLPAV